MYLEQLRSTITSMLGKTPTDQQVADIGQAAIFDAMTSNRFTSDQLHAMTGQTDPAAITAEQTAQVGNVLLSAECLQRLRNYYINRETAQAPARAATVADAAMAGLT